MNIAEARAYNDGIEFYIHRKNITISVKRDLDGKIVVKKINTTQRFEKFKKGPIVTIAIFVLSVILSLISKHCNDFKVELLGLLAIIWISTFLFYFIESRNSKKFMLFKYYAAEHKVLNYIDKYGKKTLDCNEIMKMPSVSLRCGSTVIVVVYLLVSLLTIGILFIPFIILKIIWCILSIFITLYLWANGKCNFLQKLVLKNPGYDEVEVATRGLEEYMKMNE